MDCYYYITDVGGEYCLAQIDRAIRHGTKYNTCYQCRGRGLKPKNPVDISTLPTPPQKKARKADPNGVNRYIVVGRIEDEWI